MPAGRPAYHQQRSEHAGERMLRHPEEEGSVTFISEDVAAGPPLFRRQQRMIGIKKIPADQVETTEKEKDDQEWRRSRRPDLLQQQQQNKEKAGPGFQEHHGYDDPRSEPSRGQAGDEIIAESIAKEGVGGLVDRRPWIAGEFVDDGKMLDPIPTSTERRKIGAGPEK